MRSEQEVAEAVAGMFTALQEAEIRLPRNCEEHLLGLPAPQESRDVLAFVPPVGQRPSEHALDQGVFREALERPLSAQRPARQEMLLHQGRTVARWIRAMVRGFRRARVAPSVEVRGDMDS